MAGEKRCFGINVHVELRSSSGPTRLRSKAQNARHELPWGIVRKTFPAQRTLRLTVFMLPMQQKVVMGQARWNVRSCRLASRSTSTRRRSLRTAESL